MFLSFIWGYWIARNGLAWGTLLGGEEYPNLRLGFVHIDDVVTAHLLAMEVPEAHGRYICSNEVAHFCDILEMLRRKYPNLQTASRLNYTFFLLTFFLWVYHFVTTMFHWRICIFLLQQIIMSKLLYILYKLWAEELSDQCSNIW